MTEETPTRRLRPARVAAMALAAAAVLVAAAVVLGRRELERRIELPSPLAFEIAPGESLARIAIRLEEAGLVRDDRIFLWMARWRGADRTIRHGRHEFTGSLALADLVAELERPPRPTLRVTIPEGLTAREIGALLEKAGAADASSYMAVACSPELRALVDAPPTAACAEGYLFPDTYDLVPGMSPGRIVDLQVRRFEEVMRPLLAPADPAVPRPDAAEGWKALILASIIEKETAVPAERHLVSAVFANRLRIGMPLQTDPTVIYGVIDSGAAWDGNLTRAHLETPTEYNTYRRRGLPPGPICNPGRASLEAALAPASTKHLYFVARGDGSHEFNEDLAAHNRAVRRWQLR